MAARVLKAGGVRIDPELLIEGLGAYASPDELRSRRDAELRAAYEAGVEDGRRVAEEQGAGAVPHLTRSIESAAATTRAAIADRALTDAMEVLDVAFEIATWLVGRAVDADIAALTHRVETVLPRLLPTAPVKVHVAPALIDQLGDWAASAAVELVADRGLAPGEALVDAGHAGADLTFAEARRRLLHVLDLDGSATTTGGDLGGLGA